MLIAPPNHPAPMARRQRRARTIHGVKLVDDFAWLRARNWQALIEEPSRCPPPM